MTKRQVELIWGGKAQSLDQASDPVKTCRIEEELADHPVGAAPLPRRLIHGHAVDVARALINEGRSGQIDLIYLDPPYASGVDYSHEERLEGPAGGRVARTSAYRDTWDDAASYLDMLYPCLVAAKPLLQATGAIWIQVDWRANYLVRALCDEIFGRERFLNEIVWKRAPNLGRQARSGQFGRTLDTIIVYGASSQARLLPPERLIAVAPGTGKMDQATGRFFTLAPRGDYTDTSIARLETEGRVHRSASGSVSIKYWLERDEQGRLCKRQPVDALWTDIPPLRHASPEERTGYPTQKPRALLERIIAAGSPGGGLVLDLFAGSGTTGAAATRLGRGFILGDASQVAIAAARSRLLREKIPSLRVESCGTHAANLPISIDARALGSDRMQVTFACSAEAEPVAWALGRRHPGGPFQTEWHAERGSGRRPLPLAREAILPRSPTVEARVYFVDGRWAGGRASLATEGRAEPTSLLEAST